MIFAAPLVLYLVVRWVGWLRRRSEPHFLVAACAISAALLWAAWFMARVDEPTGRKLAQFLFAMTEATLLFSLLRRPRKGPYTALVLMLCLSLLAGATAITTLAARGMFAPFLRHPEVPILALLKIVALFDLIRTKRRRKDLFDPPNPTIAPVFD